MKCLRCGGLGHMARECASPWDMFGSKGGGKGGFKGGGKKGGFGGSPPGLGGYGGKAGGKGGKKGGFGGKGPKGGGKGYQGFCWACGQQGHKQGEPACKFYQGPQSMALDAVERGEGVEFGGGSIPWELAQVSVDRVREVNHTSCLVGVRAQATSCLVGDSAQATDKCEKWEVASSRCRRKKGGQGAKSVGQEKEVWAKVEEEEVWAKVVNMGGDSMVVEVGEKFIGAVGVQAEGLLNMNFQVAGVKKALAAVSRICKAGNLVQFGERPEDCFIQHKLSQKKVMLQQRRGSYVIKVDFVKEVEGKDGDKGLKKVGSEFITIDSGAEESVCPLGWGDFFELTAVKPGKEMKMVNAGGGEMPHYGSRRVTFAAATF